MAFYCRGKLRYADDTYEDLYPRLANMGAELLVETIDRLEDGSISPVRQDDTLVSAAPKITPDDSPIDWNRPAVNIVNQIRGLAGSADAFTYLEGKRLKILRASLAETAHGSRSPGQIVDGRQDQRSDRRRRLGSSQTT